jgi:hypothetical protein
MPPVSLTASHEWSEAVSCIGLGLLGGSGAHRGERKTLVGITDRSSILSYKKQSDTKVGSDGWIQTGYVNSSGEELGGYGLP